MSMALSEACSNYRIEEPVNAIWHDFWSRRVVGKSNTLSSCPWVYKTDMTSQSRCDWVRAELHPVVLTTRANNCVSLEQSNATARVHNSGQCQAIRSQCGCKRIVGFTCVYQIDQPTDKRNGNDKKNSTSKDKEETYTTITTTEYGDKKNKTKYDKEPVNLVTAKPAHTVNLNTDSSEGTKIPGSEVLMPPFLQNGNPGGVPAFLRGNNYQLGPPQYLQGLNAQLGYPPLLRPSQFSEFNEINERDTKEKDDREETEG